MAAELTITVKNLTNGIYVTPLLIAAHDSNTRPFETGAAASTSLQAMAERGNISELVTAVGGVDGGGFNAAHEDMDVVRIPRGHIPPGQPSRICA